MSRQVDLVRLPADPADYQEEASVRPASSVFPTESKGFKKLDEDSIAAALGGKSTKFLSEAELEANKAQFGERLEDGTFSGRTLTEAILANREERDEKFKAQWKQMKTGKNRPLEPDELDFLDTLATEEAKRLRDVQEAEARALAKFQAMQKAAAAVAQAPAAPKASALKPRSVIAKKPARALRVVAKDRALPVDAEAERDGGRPAPGGAPVVPSTQDQGLLGPGAKGGPRGAQGPGIGGLLAAYVSSSDEDDADGGPG